MFIRRLQKGFTLIELMVVVSIIGILMAAGILAFTNAQQSARDSRRKADIDAISKAMEQYNQANSGSYPIASAGILTYFPTGALPLDPKTGANYTLTFGTGANAGATYCVCAALEKNTTGNASTLGATGTCAYVNPPTGADWCSSQRQ